MQSSLDRVWPWLDSLFTLENYRKFVTKPGSGSGTVRKPVKFGETHPASLQGLCVKSRSFFPLFPLLQSFSLQHLAFSFKLHVPGKFKMTGIVVAE